jgi:ubiquinone/menaquinone biosynthesis C-methylase UbiE
VQIRERIRHLLGRRASGKHASELAYWRRQREQQGELEQGERFYRWQFVEHFGVGESFFRGKRLLDVGCGPRGSLEWADEALERVGLDPLADRYVELHSRPHKMTYVASGAERIPFPDGHFDVVSTVNSLDHVDDVDAALREIARVTKPGGALLLLVDVNHEATPTEPHELGWGLVDRLGGDWILEDRRDYERPSDNLYDNLQAALPYDHSDPADKRPGVLSARFTRRSSASPGA